MFDSLGKITDLNLKDQIITFKLAFTNPSTLNKIEKYIEDEINLKLSAKPARNTERLRSMPQHRKWFACVWEICNFLVEQENKRLPWNMHLKVNAAFMNHTRHELEKKYFPCTIIRHGDQEIPYPAHVTQVTVEEMHAAIKQLIIDYTEMGVDFEAYKREAEEDYTVEEP